ncbi:MAG TPA: O-antigen ligase family protein [Roseiflexaceae bacterium]|nr:O-antigen ligase family protein [Roseiflexaceae bacterium]
MRIPLAAPLTLFLLGGLLGLPASYDPSLSAPWLLWLAAGALLYVGLCWLAGVAGRPVLAATLPTLAAAGGALLIIAQYRHLDFDPKFAPLARLGVWLSAHTPALLLPHIDANAAAAFLAGALPLALGLALDTRGPARAAWLGCAGLVGLVVLLTASRGAWAALAVVGLLAGLAWAALHLPLRRAGLLVLVAALGGAVLGWLLLARYPGAAGALGLRAADRLTVYRNDLFLALDLPFSGIGPGATFGEVYSRLQLLIQVPFIGYAHNVFLGAWLAQGLLGLLGLLGLVLGGLARIAPRLRAGAGPLAWGAALGAATPLLHGLTDAPQYDTAWTALLMAFALLAVAVQEPRTGHITAETQRTLSIHQNESLHPRCLCGAFCNSTFKTHNSTRSVLLVLVALALLARPVGAVACANAAALLRTHALLRPDLGAPARAALREQGVVWAEHGLWLDAGSAAALKQRGMLAFDAQEFGGAAGLLASAFAQRPADQSLRKALGYALLWTGRVDEAAELLAGLTYADEVREELTVWPVAWRERGREDLARLAEELGQALDARR